MTTRPPLAVAITAQQPLWTFSWELTNSNCTFRQIITVSWRHNIWFVVGLIGMVSLEFHVWYKTKLFLEPPLP